MIPHVERFDLDRRVAIVTGGTHGIGLAIAHGLAEHGASVIVSGRRRTGVEAAEKELRDAGLVAKGIAAHMGEPGQVESLVAGAVDSYGGIDIVVNNAAANPVYGPLLEAGDSAFDKIVSVNLRGPLQLARLAHPVMTGRGGGSIINISSISAIRPEKGLGLYSMSKAALISLTKVMAQEWGPQGIRANAICPGLIQTKFSTALWKDAASLRAFEKKVPLGRIGQPEDIVALAVYLASPASSYCTGSVFTVDGGATI